MSKAKTSKKNSADNFQLETAPAKPKRVHIYTKSLGTQIATSAKPNSVRKYHVTISEGTNWAVVADGNTRATRIFPDKDKAIKFAKSAAQKINGEVVIHKKSGEVEERLLAAQ